MEINTNYREIINGIGEALFIHHPSTGIIFDVNETMLKMYDFSREEVIGKTIDIISCTD